MWKLDKDSLSKLLYLSTKRVNCKQIHKSKSGEIKANLRANLCYVLLTFFYNRIKK